MTAPSALTAAIMTSTRGEPQAPLTCGSTKMPSVAPTLAVAAAKPLADARMPVGNSSGARVKVVALGPGVHREVEQDEAGEHERHMRGCAAAGKHREQQDEHAERHAGEADDLHVDAAEARHRPQPDEEADQQEQVDGARCPWRRRSRRRPGRAVADDRWMAPRMSGVNRPTP